MLDYGSKFNFDAFMFSYHSDEYVQIRSASFSVGFIQILNFEEKLNELKNLPKGDYQLFSLNFLFGQIKNYSQFRIDRIDNLFMLRSYLGIVGDFCVSQVYPSSVFDCSKWRIGGIPEKNNPPEGVNPVSGNIINDYRILLFVLQGLAKKL